MTRKRKSSPPKSLPKKGSVDSSAPSPTVDRPRRDFSKTALVTSFVALIVAGLQLVAAIVQIWFSQPNIDLKAISIASAVSLTDSTTQTSGISLLFTNSGQSGISIIGIDVNGDEMGEKVDPANVNSMGYLQVGLCPGTLPVLVEPGGAVTIRVLGVDEEDIADEVKLLYSNASIESFKTDELDIKADNIAGKYYAGYNYIDASSCRFPQLAEKS